MNPPLSWAPTGFDTERTQPFHTQLSGQRNPSLALPNVFRNYQHVILVITAWTSSPSPISTQAENRALPSLCQGESNTTIQCAMGNTFSETLVRAKGPISEYTESPSPRADAKSRLDAQS